MKVTYAEKLEAAKKAKEEASALAKDHLTDEMTAIFNKHPELIAVRWTQYTPYFNDGDACEFSVHEPQFKFTVAGCEDIGEEDDFEEVYTYKGCTTPQVKQDIAKAVQAIINGVDEADMETLFGDHVEVTATREGFQVDSYSHY